MEHDASLMEGRTQFEDARMKAFWKDMLGHIFRNEINLWSFDDVKNRLRLRDENYRGLQEVPVDRIVGSVGRYGDFTSTFLPKRSSLKERWSRIYAMYNSLEGLPPVELYKIDDVYFVRDGNHRVSVAKRLGAPTVEAYVTELSTPVDLEPGMSEEQWTVAERYAWFLDKTGLQETRPRQERLLLSEPYRYNELLAHVRIVQTVMSHIRGEDVSLRDAATTWYDRVYLPAIQLIRKYGILDSFPDRTETDLYVWIVDHLLYLRDRYGTENQKISSAMAHFLEFHNIPVPEELHEEDDEPLP